MTLPVARLCRYPGCKVVLSHSRNGGSTGMCNKHFQSLLDPHRGHHHHPATPVAPNDFCNAVAASIRRARAEYGIMPRCRHCPHDCKVAVVPNGRVVFCPADDVKVDWWGETWGRIDRVIIDEREI